LKDLLLIMNSLICWFIFKIIYWSHYICRIKQIFNKIDIYFLEAYLNLVALTVNLIENLSQGSGNDAFSLLWRQWTSICAHGISLSTTCLSIWKYTNVMAIDERLNEVLDFFINIDLVLISTKHMIEAKWVNSRIIRAAHILLGVSWYFKLNLLIIENLSAR
jgi:hypothetical protein